LSIPAGSPSFSPNSTACPAQDLALHCHPRLRRPRRHRQAQVNLWADIELQAVIFSPSTGISFDEGLKYGSIHA